MTNIELPVQSPDHGRPLTELRESGLLWLINRQVFHPRGWALAFHLDAEGAVAGWSLLGDGIETWTFGPDTDEDAHLAAVTKLLTPALKAASS